VTTDDVLQSLLGDATIRSFIDTQWDVPSPHTGSGEIKLFIIGQDPTVGRQVNTVLTLDEPKSNLRRYVEMLANQFGISVDENVYATNLCKNFFVNKPTAIISYNVIELTAPYWIPVLRRELADYPDALVISLGEPLLKVLVTSGSTQLKDYWGYKRGWNKNPALHQPMSAIEASYSAVNSRIFPFPHQPTFERNPRGEFYRQNIRNYVDYCLKTHLGK